MLTRTRTRTERPRRISQGDGRRETGVPCTDYEQALKVCGWLWLVKNIVKPTEQPRTVVVACGCSNLGHRWPQGGSKPPGCCAGEYACRKDIEI